MDSTELPNRICTKRTGKWSRYPLLLLHVDRMKSTDEEQCRETVSHDPCLMASLLNHRMLSITQPDGMLDLALFIADERGQLRNGRAYAVSAANFHKGTVEVQ